MRSDQLSAQTCRVVTRGRRTGTEHVVQVWFVQVGTRFFAASRHGLEGDWLQNALHQGELEVTAGRDSWTGPASLAAADDIPAVVDAFAEKYHRHPAIIAAWRASPPVFVLGRPRST